MKLVKYNEYREGFDNIDQPYYGDEDEESLYDDSSLNDKYINLDEIDEEDEDDEDDTKENKWNLLGDDSDSEREDGIEHLASLIRQMIRLSKIDDFYVFTNEDDISIQFVLNKTERFTSMMKILGLLKKIGTDTLIQYDSDVDLWETKDGRPLLTVDFYYDSNKKGSYSLSSNSTYTSSAINPIKLVRDEKNSTNSTTKFKDELFGGLDDKSNSTNLDGGWDTPF